MPETAATPTNDAPAQQIEYARRVDDGLRQAYRIVGWFFVLNAISASVNLVTVYVTLRGGNVSLPWAQWAYTIPSILSAVGGIGMVLEKKWGASLLVGLGLVRALLPLVSGLVAGALGSLMGTPIFVANSLVSALVAAYLPYAMRRLAIRRGMFD